MSRRQTEKAGEGISTWLTEGQSKAEFEHLRMLALIAFEIECKRGQLEMSQKEFAKYMGVSQGMVSKWESGEYNFTITTLMDICSRLNLNLNISIGESTIGAGTSYEVESHVTVSEPTAAFKIPYKELIVEKICGIGDVIA